MIYFFRYFDVEHFPGRYDLSNNDNIERSSYIIYNIHLSLIMKGRARLFRNPYGHWKTRGGGGRF